MVPSIKAPSKGGRRTYVLDTNVLLYDPNALFVFQEHELVIPITVIEEIDRFKKDLNETGRNARHVSRHLDAMRAQGSLARGVPLPSGGSLRVDIPTSGNQLPPGFSTDTNDALILNSVLGLAKGAEAGQVVFLDLDGIEEAGIALRRVLDLAGQAHQQVIGATDRLGVLDAQDDVAAQVVLDGGQLEPRLLQAAADGVAQ